MPSVSDASLHSLLDSLTAPASTGSSTGSSSSSPASPRAASTSLFTRGEIPGAYAAANAQLARAGLAALAPLADSSARVAHDALAEALGVIVVVARSREAAVGLRRAEGERREKAEGELAAVRAEVGRLREKVRKGEKEVGRVAAEGREGVKRAEGESRKALRDVGELKGRLAAVERREGALRYEVKRREREMGRLQEKVHAMLVARNAVCAPVVTVDGRRVYGGGEDEEPWGDGDGDAFVSVVGEAYEERVAVVRDENVALRAMVSRMQAELDDMLGAYGAAGGARVEREEEVREEGMEELEEGGGAQEAELTEAPSVEVMELPFEDIREDLESGFAQRCALLRKALGGGDVARGAGLVAP